jgi:3-phosphoshikimate 1-carboxyvinyltransferase
MIATIQPSTLKGAITAPSSKSSMQRALAAALLSKGQTVLQNPGHSNDDKAALDIIKALGATVVSNNEGLIINNSASFRLNDPVTINCGESGLSIRMFTPIAALSNKEIIITGEGSLKDRPMDFFSNVLPQLNVKIKSEDGKLPLAIQGPLQPANIEVDGSLSSQFLTGLLMAFSAARASDITIKVNNLKSRPYIDLTLDVMKQFGMHIPENINYELFHFAKPIHSLQSTTHYYTVEGDWSSASFLLVAAAIAGSISIRGLDLNSTQADKAIVDALMAANVSIAMEAKGIKVHRFFPVGNGKAFEFDATDCPDLFPPLVALAAYCNGSSKIKGVNRLINKESNRAISLQEEFGKMGLKIDINEDEMIIRGGRPLKGMKVHSHHDHRIAMACAVAALGAQGNTQIEEALAVRKSYPLFYTDLKNLGANVSLPYHQFNL